MFKMVNGLKRERSRLINRDPFTFTCTVGKKPSQAEMYVNDVSEVQHILEMIRGSMGTFKKNFSHGDLISLSRQRTIPILMTPDSKVYKQVVELNESGEEEAPQSPRNIFRGKKRRATMLMRTIERKNTE